MGLKEAIAILIFLFFLRGCYDFLTNYEVNKCQMTYMFEYPDYIKIPLRHDTQIRFPKYNLYVYGEGSGKLSGIPILFIPGNAGSYKQARSIGSVLLRMVESSNSKFHFNVFTIDFDEELSGLYGGVLEHQTEYVTECIKQILSLYQKKGIARDKIILYGHSMGGLIARAVFTHPDFDHNSVHLMINLATPNLAPGIISIDKYLHKFYHKVNYHWIHNISADGGGIDHVSVISIGGGDRDILVRSYLTRMDPLASSIPNSWASTDHLCIIWCKQLVLATARMLIDTESKRNANAKHYPNNMFAFKKIFEFLPNGFWRERNDKTWIFFRKMVLANYYFADIYTEPDNLSSNTEMLTPYEGMTRRVIHLSVSELKSAQYTHVMVYSSLTNNKVEVIGERYPKHRRHINFHITGGWDFLFAPQIVLYSTAPKATFYNISLVGLRSLWQAYIVKVESKGCQKPCKGPGKGLAQLIARFYGMLLPSYIVANILLGFSAQLFQLASPGPDLLSSLSSCSPLNLVAIPSLLSILLQPSVLFNMLFFLPIPDVDDTVLSQMGLSFIALRPLIYMISYGAVFLSSWLLYVLVIFWSSCFGWIKSRIRKKWDVSVPTEKQLCHISMSPIIMSCLVIAITYVTCGSFILSFTLVLLFGLLCNMCCDNRVLADRKGEHRFSTRWRLYFTIFLLWLWMALISIPSLIHWFKNLNIQLKLIHDPALITAIVPGFSLFVILQCGVPTEHTSTYFISAIAAYIASILTTMYGFVNIYRIPYFISAVLMIFSMQQIASIILRKKALSKIKKD
ncbi:GPI inositol-deacylase [Nymphon striatum]|nr:GPI inositol-deacylase [Nymphon striatum]